MVAERPFEPDVVARDRALEHDLGVGRDLQVDRLALDELHRRALEEPCDHELADVLRQRRARRVGGDGVETDGHCDRNRPFRRFEQVGAPVLVDLPVHEGRAPVDLLHPVHADVADTRARIARDHGRERDERCRVARPAAHDRQRIQVDVVTREDDLLARPLRDLLGHRVRDRLELAERAHLVDEAVGGLHLEHALELGGDVVETLDSEREAHSPLAPELVDQERMLRSPDVLEQQGGTAGLDDPVGDLGDLEIRVDLDGDTCQLSFALQKPDPLAQVGDG